MNRKEEELLITFDYLFKPLNFNNMRYILANFMKTVDYKELWELLKKKDLIIKDFTNFNAIFYHLCSIIDNKEIIDWIMKESILIENYSNNIKLQWLHFLSSAVGEQMNYIQRRDRAIPIFELIKPHLHQTGNHTIFKRIFENHIMFYPEYEVETIWSIFHEDFTNGVLKNGLSYPNFPQHIFDELITNYINNSTPIIPNLRYLLSSSKLTEKIIDCILNTKTIYECPDSLNVLLASYNITFSQVVKIVKNTKNSEDINTSIISLRCNDYSSIQMDVIFLFSPKSKRDLQKIHPNYDESLLAVVNEYNKI